MREKERLEKVASQYQIIKDFDFFVAQYEAKLISKKAKGPRVLELGCGSGLMTQEFVKKFPEVVVVEGSGKYLQQAKRKVKKVTAFYLSLFEDFQTKEKFNSIIMVRILEHVKDPILLLKRAKGWLAQKGLIHIIVPNGESLHRRIGQKMGLLRNLTDFSPHDKKSGHRRVYTLETIIRDIRKSGLQVIYQDGVFLKPLSGNQMLSWDKKVIDALFEVAKQVPIELCAELYLICRKGGVTKLCNTPKRTK